MPLSILRGFPKLPLKMSLISVNECSFARPDETVTVAAVIGSDAELTCLLDSPLASCQLSVALSIDEKRSNVSHILSPVYNTTVYAPAPRPTVRFSDTG